MKTAIFFLFTTFISIACLESALGAKQPWLLYAIGFGVWVPFVLYLKSRTKRNAERRSMEKQFLHYMRNGRR